MNEWYYSNTDIAPPSYLEVKAIVDGWVDSLTFEKDTIIFEKGSSIGAEDKIVLSVVEGEEIPASLTLRETNNNYPNDYGSVERLDFRTNEVLSTDGEVVMDKACIQFEGGIIGLPESDEAIFQLT